MKENKKHASYGMIRFARIHGNGTTFFGSPLVHDSFIEIEIDRGSVRTEYGKEWYGSEERVLRARMTHSQFAELITSLNMGTGVPCTLESIQGQKQGELPAIETPQLTANNEFKGTNKEVVSFLKEGKKKVEGYLGKSTLNKAERSELLSLVNKMVMTVEQNIPFYEKCFEERMEKVVSNAKTEIEASLNSKLTALGLKALQENTNIKLID